MLEINLHREDDFGLVPVERLEAEEEKSISVEMTIRLINIDTNSSIVFSTI